MNFPYRFELSAIVTDHPEIERTVTNDGRVKYTVTLISEEVTIKADDGEPTSQ